MNPTQRWYGRSSFKHMVYIANKKRIVHIYSYLYDSTKVTEIYDINSAKA